MPLPHAIANFNRKFTNRALRHLSGFGPFAEIEHVGRRSGRVHRTMMLAFRRGDVVTIALTYGPDVDWLRNIETAGGARLHCGSERLDLGPVVHLSTAAGRARMPGLVRVALSAISVTEFVELPVLSAEVVA
jgi:deazaflavin-dependent oxidoreductase (nitroreductase family)